jgi:hypothetical protein
VHADYDPFQAEARREQEDRLAWMGRAFNGSVEDKLAERLFEIEERLDKEFNRIDGRLAEGLGYLYSIDKNLLRIIRFGEISFYGAAGYFVYLIIKKYLT